MPDKTFLNFEVAFKGQSEEAEKEFSDLLEGYIKKKAKQMNIKVIGGPNQERQNDRYPY